MKLIRKLKSLFQKKKKLNDIKPRTLYIKNMMIIRGNQFVFYETKKYLSKNNYMYFVYYDNLSKSNQSIAVYNIPAMYLIEELFKLNINGHYELYTFDETHHQVRTDIYYKKKYYKGSIFETNPQNDYLSEVMTKCKFSFAFFSHICHIEKIITNREKLYNINQLLNNSIDSTRSERNRKESRHKLYFSMF